MLTPEEARRRLDSLRDPQWREAALGRAAKLPDAQRAVAEAILEASGCAALPSAKRSRTS